MKPFGKRRNGTCRQARTDKLCQIVRVLDGLAQHLPPAQNLGDRFYFHTGPLAVYDTPFGQFLQSGSPAGMPCPVCPYLFASAAGFRFGAAPASAIAAHAVPLWEIH